MSTLNFNIGVLGHVDSGKTSLSKALSTIASTACFDKNPQSKERGITLDLGFSSFTIESSEVIKQRGYDFVQYTLVDCPGHASLIKTIIGGAQIIDMMFLVIDIVKGMQTQTAECLIIGEICCDKLLIILNKLDMIEESKRLSTIEKMSKRLLKTLENTKFANSPIIAVAANPQNQLTDSEIEKLTEPVANMTLVNSEKIQISAPKMLNMDILLEIIKNNTFFPEKRNENGEFLFAVDHCFTIKGQGAVMTGTVLNGQVKINDNVEIPILKAQKKIKSIQVFKKPVEKASKGDRCGICITNFDSKQFERGIVCAPNYVKHSYAVLIRLNRIKHFKNTIESGSKFHITIGHETILAKVEIFGESIDDNQKTASLETGFNFDKEYLYLDEYVDQQSDVNQEKNFKHKISNHYALIDFAYDNTPDNVTSGVLCTINSLLIGSKLDTDIHLNQCRIAFYGNVLHSFTNKDFKDSGASQGGAGFVNRKLSDLKIYKEKFKEGIIERKHDEYTLIGKSLFKKETNIDLFVGLKVKLSSGETGRIESGFGQSGKFKIRLDNGLFPATKEQLDSISGNKSKKKQDVASNEIQSSDSTPSNGPIKIFLNFKRFIYDEKKKMIQ